ncbi:nuclease-related domain-containing protein [Planomicrobium sp. MB-3u-38]|uniref:nuclease-related domain-containing protein n=1 Tax=Planomicrobium sp. MB-3u-38 TaxID=2058318 RepID=UPI001E38E834|nr:nuclease-related domain-containing protein [Planomicrobium sp. MB-3u-38]
MEKECLDLLCTEDAIGFLIGRLTNAHPQRHYLAGEQRQIAAGVRGEDRMRKHFVEFHSHEEFHVLWDVSLAMGDWKIQMDGLLLTERCAIIMDSKNISGKIHFDGQTGEFYRFDDENVKNVMKDPRIQLNKNIRFLAAWFQLKKIKLPVSGLIIFTPKSCEFIVRPKSKHICKVYQMPEYLLQILKAFPLEAEPLKLPKIKKQLISANSPYLRTPLCSKYYIEANEIRRGIQCTECQKYGMKRIKKSWQCAGCGHRDRQAHKFALREYFSLIDTHITNQAFREWCGVESRSVATRLLTQYDLETSGESKARKYSLKKRD